jgi:thiol-disulfide isomerase/thioredoxin
MKKIVSILIISTVSIFAQEKTFLKGKITNPTGKKCYLYTFEKADESKKIMIDSSEVSSDGKFSMGFQLKNNIQGTFDDGNEQTTLLINKGDNLYLTLNTKMFDETINYSGKGAEKNNGIKNLILIKEGIEKTAYGYKLDVDSSALFSYLGMASSDFKTLTEDYKKEMPELNDFIQQENKNLENLIKSFKDQLNFLSGMKALKGKPIIDFEGVDLNGKKIKISNFKGKITVIDFWATWCGPCKAEIPSLKALEEKYGSKVNFVSVGLWDKKEDWAKMATDIGLKNNIYIPKELENQFKDYQIYFIPRYFVLDENMKIISAHAPVPSSGALENYFK